MKKPITYLLSLAFLLFFSIPSLVLAATLQGKVVKVADGDTITIVDDSGNKHRIRLGGIDAPEKDQPYGKESTQSLLELTSGKTVVIEYEKRDRYKRIIGKVLVGENLANILIDAGMAVKYDGGKKIHKWCE
jgi:endonuclease YncB( thermonuclease family)